MLKRAALQRVEVSESQTLKHVRWATVFAMEGGRSTWNSAPSS